jgi:1,4-alpha-glucan branching enzyme
MQFKVNCRSVRVVVIFLMGLGLHFQALANLAAPAWTEDFFTDDSAYYQRLYADGFEQRFWVRKTACDAFERADIILKNAPSLGATRFVRLTGAELASWPTPYGLNNNELCWYTARVRGLDLARPLENFYQLRFIDRLTKRTLYFQDYQDSLLPASRFTTRPTSWIIPGPLGATPLHDGKGFFFRLWEPVADAVHLYIDDELESILTPTRILNDDRREHLAYLPNARRGQHYHYQFIKDGSYEELEVDSTGVLSPVKIDPFAREIFYEKKGGSLNNYLNPRGILADVIPQFDWKNDSLVLRRDRPEHEPWLIYQLWPLAFNPQKVDGRYQVGTFNDIHPKIDYLANLGINAIEFLPIHESRFNASWGYALDSLILIEQTLGSRRDVQALVDALHGRDLRVILDVVINHVNNTLIRDPLSATVSTSKYYGGNTEWGPKPRFQSFMVRKWIADSFMSLIRDYHIDGFRYDMIEYVYIGSATGYRFVQELNILTKIENPNFYASAEQLPDNAWATYPIAQGGLGFDSQWNDKFKNVFEDGLDHYRISHREFNTSPLIGSLMGYSNHRNTYGQEYHFGGPLRTVNYIGSHDFVGNKDPILRIVSDYLSFEVDGHNTFYRVSPLTDPVNLEGGFRQIHNEFTHRVGKLAYGTLMTRPGSVLFFQGEEFAQDINIENEWSYIEAQRNNSLPSKDVDVHRFVGSHRVPWDYLNTWESERLSFLTPREHQLFEGYHEFFKAMLKFKRDHPNFNFEDARSIRDHGRGVVSFTIGQGPQMHFVVLNFGHEKLDQWLPFPGSSTDWWKEVINSSDPAFGTNQDNRMRNPIPQVGGRNNLVRLDGTSLSIFTRSKQARIDFPLYLRSNLTNWVARGEMRLTPVSDNGELYGLNIAITEPTELEFKIASLDWSFELGASEKEIEGQMSSVPDQPNQTVTLSPGNYRFVFNLRTFRFYFLRGNE